MSLTLSLTLALSLILAPRLALALALALTPAPARGRYLTLQPAYEAAQIGVFGKMVLNGHIFRGRKPVHWSPSSRTALAEAELEYPEDHVSKSIYAAFEVSAPSAALAPLVEGAQVRVAIWTTTPWTIPANLAVAVNGKLSYAVVGHPALPYKLVVAEELVGALRQRLSALPEGEELQAAPG